MHPTVVAPDAAQVPLDGAPEDQAARAEVAVEARRSRARQAATRSAAIQGILRPSALSSRQRQPAPPMRRRPAEAETDNGSGNGGGPSAASNASPVSDRPIVDSVVAAVGPVETDNLLLSPIRDSQDVSVGPLASNDPSARRDDVLKAVADSPVGAETIYGEGDAKKVADLVGLGPASAESENGGEQRIDIVPEPATLTLVAITLAGTLYRHRRRRTASCC